MFTANAKLGPAGRLALAAGDRERDDAEGGGRRLLRVAGDRPSLVASPARRRARRSARSGCLAARSLEPPAPQPAAARRASRRSGSASAGAAPAGGRGWSPARPAIRTRRSGRCFAATASRGRRGRRREPANRYEWPCPGDLLHMDTARYARFERPGHAVTGDRSQRSRNWMTPEHAGRLRLRPRDRRRPLAPRLRRAARPTSGPPPSPPSSSARSPGSPRTGSRARRLMTDNAWSYAHNRSLRELLGRARHQAPDHPALPAAHQRQGRALPPNHGPRVGLRPEPTAHTATATEPCHTGSPLQRAQTPQLDRRPAADQPRSQPPWAGQLDRTTSGVPYTPDTSHTARGDRATSARFRTATSSRPGQLGRILRRALSRNTQTPLLERAGGSTATGIRTPVSAVRGRRPSPLDDGGSSAGDCSGPILARPGFWGYAPGVHRPVVEGSPVRKPARSRHCERALKRR